MGAELDLELATTAGYAAAPPTRRSEGPIACAYQSPDTRAVQPSVPHTW